MKEVLNTMGPINKLSTEELKKEIKKIAKETKESRTRVNH